MPTPADLQAAIDAANASVTAEGDVVNSAVLLLGNLSQMLKDAIASGTPQEKIDQVAAIANAIDNQKQALADAVAANTPAA